jgi:hypothetical protein
MLIESPKLPFFVLVLVVIAFFVPLFSGSVFSIFQKLNIIPINHPNREIVDIPTTTTTANDNHYDERIRGPVPSWNPSVVETTTNNNDNNNNNKEPVIVVAGDSYGPEDFSTTSTSTTNTNNTTTTNNNKNHHVKKNSNNQQDEGDSYGQTYGEGSEIFEEEGEEQQIPPVTITSNKIQYDFSKSLLSTSLRSTISEERYRKAANQYSVIGTGTFSKGGEEATSDDFEPITELAQFLYRNLTRPVARACLKNKRIYMAGTSFQRSMFWSVIKYLRLNPTTDPIPEELLMIGSSVSTLKKFTRGHLCHLPSNKTFRVHAVPWLLNDTDACLIVHDEGCNFPGPSGIDVQRCGLPMHGTWQSGDEKLNVTVHYQFKTYIRAPPVDSLIVKNLKHAHWDLAWISSGEWGSFNQQGPIWTRKEAEDFLLKLSREFKGLIIVSGDSSYIAPCRFFLETARELGLKERIFVFDERDLVRAGRREKVEEGHGHLGALTEAFVRAVLGVLCLM